MENWQRRMYYEDTGLPWVMPSPNMPTVDTAVVYPGTVLFEGTNVSEGRGTTRPFELIGAPWVDAEALADETRDATSCLACTSVRSSSNRHFRSTRSRRAAAVRYTCSIATRFRWSRPRSRCSSKSARRTRSRFEWRQPPYEYEHTKLPFDILAGSSELRQQIEAGLPVQRDFRRAGRPITSASARRESRSCCITAVQPDHTGDHMDHHTRATFIARYKDGYREVAAALEGASDKELDSRPAPGKWSAREIVHHLADSEMTSAIRLRLLVAEENAAIRPYDENAVRDPAPLRSADREFAARVPGGAPVDWRAARAHDGHRFRRKRARTPSTAATASSAGWRFTPNTRTSTPIRFAGHERQPNEPVLHLFDFNRRRAVPRDVGVFQSRRARSVVADVAIGHGAPGPRRVRVEWEPTEFADEMLGRLGGTFHGTVMEYKPDREFFVAEAFWLPPDGNPIGPMALEVSCEPQRMKNPQITLVKVTQRASEDGDRWKRYYEVIAPGWERALQSLKRYLESREADYDYSNFCRFTEF